MHAVVAIDEERDRILMVTIYLPTGVKRENDWRTRKR